ncbi:major facilitator superfamily domain-containing protein [Dactylonectria estremocensis]|uniref:Major facilitator superfamily domain-containing protein n=1 Tax=Dactylonectria estremocensis TaxID=1079267 RepID=A0A9P9J657_9HYPO|nr:major facilitator superfamily domain-containing protein [Dactylonectria estremocensis]
MTERSLSPPAPHKPAPVDISGSVYFISSSGRVLQLPIPSNSARDPLRWSWKKRWGAFLALQFYSVVSSFGLTTPGFLAQAMDYEFDPETIKPFSVSSLSSAMTLFTGLGYLLSIPISTSVGRRPVFLAAAAISTISTLWAGLSGDFVQLLIAICLQAIAVGSAISMCQLIILDATFIHERPFALSIYWCTGGAIVRLFLIALPFTTDLQTQWRPVYDVWFGMCLLSFILILLFVPESFFLRPPVALDGRILVQSGMETVQIYEDWSEISTESNQKPLPDIPPTNTIGNRLKITQAPGTTWRSLPAAYMQMLLCFCNPLIIWVALLSSSILTGVIFLNMTQPAILRSPPWNQDPERVSIYLGVSGIFGSLLALPVTGPLITWSIRYFALRSNGTRHAEVYLPGFIPPVFSAFSSLLLFYLTIRNEWSTLLHYTASALSIFSYASGNVAFVLWMTEAFPNLAAAALALFLFFANMVSFGTGAVLMTAIKNRCITPPSLIIMGIILGLGVVAVPVSFWGKAARQFIHGRFDSTGKTALRPQQ